MTPLRRSFFAVLATALILTACGGSEPASTDYSGDATPTASGKARAGGKPKGGSQGVTSPGAAVPGGPTTGSGTGTGGTGSGQPAAPTGLVPNSGTYTYAQSGKTVRGDDFPNRGTLAVGQPSAIAGGARQEQTRRKLQEGEGDRVVYAFFKDKVVIEKAYRANQWCELKPALKVVQLPLKVGDAWTSHSECTVSNITVTFDYSAQVLRREVRRVGSTNVDTFVLSSTLKITAGTFGSSTEKATSWLSPKYKLVVRSEETSESPAGEGTFTEQLLSLEPKG